MAQQRFDPLDALRGLALIWMAVYHLCFDLNHFGYWRQDFYHDSFWTWQRTCILGLFLFCAGVGQAIALQQGQTWPRFWRRWLQIAGCALLVTIGSGLMYPRSTIFFGVLHGMAVMLIVARLTGRWGRWLWLLGAVAVGSPMVAAALLGGSPSASTWNSGALNWLGWITAKPVTEDYVPIFPWIGLMWWGMASGQWVLRQHPGVLALPLPAPGHALAALGRWSLSFYMLHQPVMIGLLMLAATAQARA